MRRWWEKLDDVTKREMQTWDRRLVKVIDSWPSGKNMEIGLIRDIAELIEEIKNQALQEMREG
jgi:hypothetical protein